MSGSSESSPPIKIVDTVPSLISLLDVLTAGLSSPKTASLYLSIIPRNTTTPVVLVLHYIFPYPDGKKDRETTYLVDISTLSAKALVTTRSTPLNSNIEPFSLKRILESSSIPQIVFGVRDISNFLFTQCDITLKDVQDVQLMELAVRNGTNNNLRDLAKCVELHSPLPDSTKMKWAITQDAVQKVGMQIRERRPMKPEIMQYYAGEASMLPGLYKRFRENLRPEGQSFWRNEIEIATKDRIEKSKSPDYDIQGKDKVMGPWDDEYIQEATDRWNDDVLDKANEEAFDLEYELNDEEEDDWDDLYQDTARDCIGWEEDMEKNGEYF